MGFDAGAEFNDALALGHALAEAHGAELHVAIVLPRGHAQFEEAIARRPTLRAAGSGALRLRHAPTRRHRLREGQPLDGARAGRSAARALYEYAEGQQADLIVVGSCHRGKLGRVLVGSVAESLLRGAPCAVAVAPRGFARQVQHGFDLIGVAYDGSPEAGLALKEAESLANMVKARPRLITVVPPTSAINPQVDELERKALRRQYRGILEWGASNLVKGVQQETVLMEGDPATILAEQGRELGLLVLGSRGYGVIRSALLPPRWIDPPTSVLSDIAAWRVALGRPDGLIFPRRSDGMGWRKHDWDNWRKRQFGPAAGAAGLLTWDRRRHSSGADRGLRKPRGARGGLVMFGVCSESRVTDRSRQCSDRASKPWARLVSNQRPLACEASALPLSYAPSRRS